MQPGFATMRSAVLSAFGLAVLLAIATPARAQIGGQDQFFSNNVPGVLIDADGTVKSRQVY